MRILTGKDGGYHRDSRKMEMEMEMEKEWMDGWINETVVR